jgi:hypothetical protein
MGANLFGMGDSGLIKILCLKQTEGEKCIKEDVVVNVNAVKASPVPVKEV